MTDEILNYSSFSIIGAARSGISAAKLLSNKGYKVFLSESENLDKIQSASMKVLNDLKIDLEFGKHSKRVFENDALIVSPGVPQDSEVITKAISLRKPVFSEIEAASWFCKGKVIAVTGTNGKTTTTSLIGKIFADAGFSTYICGNIGMPFSEVSDTVGENGVAVVEVSSFQLDNIKTFKPDTAALLNITPDHLDRYNSSFTDYIGSKFRIIENQRSADSFIYNYDDPVIKKNLKKNIKPMQMPFSILAQPEGFKQTAFKQNGDIIFSQNETKEAVVKTQELIIKGEHNIYNVLCSIAAAKRFGIRTQSIANSVRDFSGVEHRLEFVREFRGVKFYNDSKATNVNSVWYAIRAFSSPIILMLGGRDKGNDYNLIEQEVKHNVKFLIAFGESKNKVYNFFKGKVPVILANSLEDAVNKAFSKAAENYTVLFSPACASFDEFENYEHRGREFKKIVGTL